MYTIWPNQRAEWVDSQGKVPFLWKGISIYPRLSLLKGRRRSVDASLPTDAVPPGAPALVEACCEEGSLLSRRSRWSRNRDVVCITEKLDFTSRNAIKISKSKIIGKADALWLSCPCTGGSTWVYINWHRGEDVRNKIREHWDLFHRIWKAFEEVAEHAIRMGARVFIEWPRGCAYWREPAVVRFLSKHRLQFADFDGCMYGLRATGGRHDGDFIKKPWRVACTPNSSLPSFLNKKCDGTHHHTPCQGSYTKKTQCYTPPIAKQVHRSLNYDMEKDGLDNDTACCFVGIEASASRLDYDPSLLPMVQGIATACPIVDSLESLPPACAAMPAKRWDNPQRKGAGKGVPDDPDDWPVLPQLPTALSLIHI